MIVSPDLIQKYNRQTPRYTSYPPANYFTPKFTGTDYIQAVIESNQRDSKNISFYIHVPFCPRLCHYCACNAYAMESKASIETYMQAVLDEIDLIIPHLDKNRPISQIHYGGGTPTAIPLHWLAKINDKLQSHFPLMEGAEIAIECHPGYLSMKGWQELIDAGFNRMSLGVQDFHSDVLDAVNRQASRERFEDIFALLRNAGIQINLDLIYGLPKQTPETFAENIQKAIALAPDRLVTFSYAHVPWVKASQTILEKLGLPNATDKTEMFARTKQLLQKAGYHSVGLDHFVHLNDPLFIAQEQGLLHRNFQGYCTRATTGQVYAFGVTAISQLSMAFAQNTKSIKGYVESIQNKQLALERGYRLSEQEHLAGESIASIMCNGQVKWTDITSDIANLEKQIYLNKELLNALSDDRLIVWDREGIIVTDQGRPFIRVIASALDPLMADTNKKMPYSMAL